MRLRTGLTTACSCALALACGGDSAVLPITPPAPLTIVSGNAATDTVKAKLLQALVVEVRSGGVLKSGVIVRFDVLPSGNATRPYESTASLSSLSSGVSALFVADSTDATGRVKVLVQLGTIAGPASVLVSVPEFGLADTAHFTVQPGAAKRITLKVRDTSVTVGATYPVGAAAADTYGNARTDQLTYAAVNSALTVDASGIIKAVGSGRGVVAISIGAVVDTARASVVPDGTIVGALYDATGPSISMIKLDGTGYKRLTSIGSQVVLPRFDASGSKVVFYEGDPNGGARIYTVDMLGVRSQLAIAAGGPATQFFPTYSADGQQLFFNGIPAGSYQWEIYRSQADGSTPVRLTTTTNGSSSQPCPSPDGAKVVFNSNGTISTVDVATKAVKSLGIQGDFPRYSPSGTQITFLTVSGGQRNLAIMNADGSNVRLFSGRSYDLYSAPSWSPDGTWIMVAGPSGLELVRASTFELLPLPRILLYQASFKP